MRKKKGLILALFVFGNAVQNGSFEVSTYKGISMGL